MGARIYVICFLLLSALVAIIALAVVSAKSVQAGSHLNTTSMEFAAYKNTDYAACTTVSQCPTENMHQLVGSSVFYFDPTLSPSEFCGCFGGLIVVPSTARDSAFSYSWVRVATGQTSAILGNLWLMFQLAIGKKSRGTMWNVSIPVVVYDLFTFIYWWYGYINFMTKPAFAQAPSILQWMSSWRYIYLCIAHRTPWAIFASLVFIIQWGATISAIHVMNMLGDEPKYQEYDIQKQGFDVDSSAATNCTVDQLGNRTDLFVGPYIGHQDDVVIELFVDFILVSLAAMGGLLFQIKSILDSDTERAGHRCLLVITIAMLPMEYWFLLSPTFQEPSGQASVLYDPICTVIHVTMSKSKGLLDVNMNARVQRLLRAWVNV
jgi:hypothetical protein